MEELTRYFRKLGVDSSADDSQQIGAVQHGALGHAAHLLVVCKKNTQRWQVIKYASDISGRGG